MVQPDASDPQRPVVAAAPPLLAYASPDVRPPPARWGLLLVAIAVLLRLAFALSRPADATTLVTLPDQLEYLLIGQSIRDGGGCFYYNAVYDQNLVAYRMPGYPLLVALCGAELRGVRAVQAMLDGSSVAAVFWIARRLRGDVAALIAASLVALNPYLIYFSSLVLSETLFTAVLAWGVAALLATSKWVRAAGVALLLASVYVRPSAVGLGVVAAAAAFGASPVAWRRVAGGAAAAIVAAMALVVLLTPWAVRNKSLLGQAVWTTTNSGVTAYDSFNPRADGSSNQAVFRSETDAALLSRVDPRLTTTQPLYAYYVLQGQGEVGRSRLYERLAWEYARSHPQRDVELAVAKLGRFWSPVPLSADFGGRWLYVLVGGAYAVPLFVLAAVGVWRGGLGFRVTLLLLLPALYFSAVHCVFVGSLRYRVPCDVPLAVLAAAGVASFARPRHVRPIDRADA